MLYHTECFFFGFCFVFHSPTVLGICSRLLKRAISLIRFWLIGGLLDCFSPCPLLLPRGITLSLAIICVQTVSLLSSNLRYSELQLTGGFGELPDSRTLGNQWLNRYGCKLRGFGNWICIIYQSDKTTKRAAVPQSCLYIQSLQGCKFEHMKKAYTLRRWLRWLMLNALHPIIAKVKPWFAVHFFETFELNKLNCIQNETSYISCQQTLHQIIIKWVWFVFESKWSITGYGAGGCMGKSNELLQPIYHNNQINWGRFWIIIKRLS